MRKLNSTQKQMAANWLAIAHAHLREAEQLAKGKLFNSALRALYFAAHFAARAAVVDLQIRSEKHSTWNGEFNRRHGRGRSWISKIYPKMLNELMDIRKQVDYQSAYPNEKYTYETYLDRVSRLIRKVISNTPLCHYEEFIAKFLENGEILALEFDYYCPKSYIHKERIQHQVMAEKFTEKTPRRLSALGKYAITKMGAKRSEDYVLGWNNRLGQSGDAYLLFLDIDEEDEGKVKTALRGIKGWLFKSGSGYHFIGKVVYTSRKDWQKKLESVHRDRKLKKILDDRFRNFSIRRGYSTLRIESSPIKDFRPFLCWQSG